MKKVHITFFITHTKNYITEVINTHDIEEYQKSVNAGFKVEGYTLVNQHSLDKNGNLVIEGRFQAEDVSLVRKTK